MTRRILAALLAGGIMFALTACDEHCDKHKQQCYNGNSSVVDPVVPGVPGASPGRIGSSSSSDEEEENGSSSSSEDEDESSSAAVSSDEDE